MAHLVTYITRSRRDPEPSGPLNIILLETHPIVWAAKPPPAARDSGQVTTILFYSQIPDAGLGDIISAADNWCEIEY